MKGFNRAEYLWRTTIITDCPVTHQEEENVPRASDGVGGCFDVLWDIHTVRSVL